MLCRRAGGAGVATFARDVTTAIATRGDLGDLSIWMASLVTTLSVSVKFWSYEGLRQTRP